jgi:titin
MIMRYLIAIFSAFLVLASMSGASAATAPDPPSNPTATAISPTQINIFWNAPINDGGSPIINYKIDYKVGSGSYSVLVPSTSATTYSHTPVTTDQPHSYKIYATNSIGTSVATAEITATPTSSSTGALPGAPASLAAYATSPTQVSLYWSAPANNGGYAITGYKIDYKVGSGSYSTLIPNTGSTSTTYSHAGLTTNLVYFYRVYAITQFGTGTSPSEEKYAQPQSSSSLTVPGAPTGLTATAVSSTQVNLSWTAPANNGGAPITGYKIESKSGSGSYTTIVSNTGSTSTAYSNTGLTTGTTYTYKVSAISNVGTGAASGEASATPSSSSSSSAPGAPTNLVATQVSSTQIDLSWTAPSVTGGSAITGYKIEVKVGSGSFSNLVANTASTATAYSHTGLTAGQAYTYRVSAINAIGTGAASGEASPGVSSTNPPGTPGGLTATAASPTQVNLSWTAPSSGGAATGYKIESKKGSGSYEVLVANTASTGTSFAHTGLTTGTTYYYRVSAVNSAGTSSSAEASATPKETTIPTLTAAPVSPTSIMLSWVAPSQTYNQSIIGYKIEEKVAQNTYQVILENTNSAGTSHTITGLTTGQAHTYVVSAYFTLGASPRSNEASATPLTSSTPPASQPTTSAPGIPTGLAATAVSPTQVNLSWNAPSSTGGSAITGYKIEYKKGTGQYETLASSTQNSTTKYSHAKLETGSTYTYRLYAINAAGISSASSEASATPTLSTSAPPSVTAPGQPTLSAVLASPTQVNLSWTAPSSGSPATGYKIEYKIGTGQYLTLIKSTTNTAYSHTGLLENTYSYRVSAVNSAGTGAPSNEVSIKTASETTEPEATPEPEPSKCGPGTVLDSQGVCVLAESEPEPDPEPEPEPEPEQTGPIQTHIPGFPDPEKDPQYYINRYNSEAEYKAWFDRNFPDQTIYEIVGLPEPEPQQTSCGPGTKLENGVCVLDEKSQQPFGGCLIATATYGTEMAPQVQQLRELRESTLLATSSGAAFMEGFNYLYYSFSPTVSDWERQSPEFKESVRLAIAPLMWSLLILNHVEIDSEYEMLGYGLGVILLNAAMYFGIPAVSILLVKKLRR